MKFTAIYVRLAAGVFAAVLSCSAVHAACPPGTVQVGERQEETADAIIIHPICEQRAGTAPQYRLLAALSKGDVTLITRDGRRITGADAAKFPLDVGTRVVTGPGSSLIMFLPDETTFHIGAEAEIVIDDFVYEPAPGAFKMTANIAVGTVRFISGKLHLHEIKLKFGALYSGIRGTDVECLLRKDGSGTVQLRSGSAVLGRVADSSEIEMRPGTEVDFDASGKLTAPKSIN